MRVMWKDKDKWTIFKIVGIFGLLLIVLYFGISIKDYSQANLGFLTMIIIFLIIIFLDHYYNKKGLKAGLVFILCFLSPIVITVIIVKLAEDRFAYYLFGPIYWWLSLILLLLLFVHEIYRIVRLKLSYATNWGIVIGNAYYRSKEDFVLKQKPILLPWDDLKEIKIIEKEVPMGKIITTKTYLYLKTKDDKVFNCLIKDFVGFERIIQKMGKERILIKDFTLSKISDSKDPEREYEKLLKEGKLNEVIYK